MKYGKKLQQMIDHLLDGDGWSETLVQVRIDYNHRLAEKTWFDEGRRKFKPITTCEKIIRENDGTVLGSFFSMGVAGTIAMINGKCLQAIKNIKLDRSIHEIKIDTTVIK